VSHIRIDGRELQCNKDEQCPHVWTSAMFPTMDKDLEDSQTGNLPILGNSERGAHNIGENPYPSTKTVNPTRAVVIETSNSDMIESGPAIPAV